MALDDEEFEQFFSAEYDGILRSVSAVIGDRESAVDAAQDAFIKAHLHWSTIRSYDSPSAWVRRAAINASRDHQRAERRRRGREIAVQPAHIVEEGSEHDGLEAEESARHLLDQLAPRQREVATMFYVEDRSVEDIASALDLSVGTVKSQLSGARQRLRQLHPH